MPVGPLGSKAGSSSRKRAFRGKFVVQSEDGPLSEDLLEKLLASLSSVLHVTCDVHAADHGSGLSTARGSTMSLDSQGVQTGYSTETESSVQQQPVRSLTQQTDPSGAPGASPTLSELPSGNPLSPAASAPAATALHRLQAHAHTPSALGRTSISSPQGTSASSFLLGPSMLGLGGSLAMAESPGLSSSQLLADMLLPSRQGTHEFLQDSPTPSGRREEDAAGPSGSGRAQDPGSGAAGPGASSAGSGSLPSRTASGAETPSSPGAPRHGSMTPRSGSAEVASSLAAAAAASSSSAPSPPPECAASGQSAGAGPGAGAGHEVGAAADGSGIARAGSGPGGGRGPASGEGQVPGSPGAGEGAAREDGARWDALADRGHLPVENFMNSPVGGEEDEGGAWRGHVSSGVREGDWVLMMPFHPHCLANVSPLSCCRSCCCPPQVHSIYKDEDLK